MGPAMGPRAVTLLCAVAAALGSVAENAGQRASCVTECAESSLQTFQKGHSYSYKYSTTTSTFLQGTAYEKSGITLEGLVVIEALGRCHLVLKLQDVQLKTMLTSSQQSVNDLQSLRILLERNPLQFSFNDGKIPLICPSVNEPTWALNIKRGILSLLQTSPTSTADGYIKEVDVLGECPTKYHLRGAVLWKTKDLNDCTQRASSFTFLRSVPLPVTMPQQQILESKMECMQSFKDGLLSETICTESHRVTPFSKDGSGAKTQTQSMLKLLTMGLKVLHKVDSKDLFSSNLLYEKELIVSKSQGEDVMETVRKLCLAPGMNSATADLFMSLVFELRLLTTDGLMELWQRSSFKCRDNWQPLVDALPSCGTEACVYLMKEILLSKEVEEEKMDSFLWSLAFIPEPTAAMIASLKPLLETPDAIQNAFLGITALLHNFCSTRIDCTLVPEVQVLMKTLQGYLGGNCSVKETEEIYKMQLFLKAIGNAGLAAAFLTPVLSSCALQQSNPSAIRLAAIEAFRRIPCSAERRVLVQLYQATGEDSELRIAAYYTLMRCPNEELFHTVQQVLRDENSSQVGSFVWSHLSQLLESDDPMKQHIRHSLPDEILSKEFDWETWKYSSYSDATFRSATGGVNLEGSLVFTPASFLPRSLMANLTFHTLGRATNLMELGIRLENAEDMVQNLFGERAAAMMDFFTFAKKTDDKLSKSDSPMDTSTKRKEKRTAKRHSRGDHLVTKSDKTKSKKVKHGCPGGKYNRINEIRQKFTDGAGDQKELQCGLSVKIFGHELSFLDCEEVKRQMKHYSLSLAELAVKLLKGQEVQFNRRMSLATEELTFPSVSGIPIQLSLNISAMANLKIKGNVDFKHQSNFFINGYIKPSALLTISAHMGTVGALGKAGLKWITGLRTASSLDGGIQVKKGRELKVFLNTPEDSMEFVDFSSRLYLVTDAGTDKLDDPKGHKETKLCTSEDVSKLFGWQLCSEMSYSDASSDLPFPLSAPTKVAVTLKKQDKGLQQYLLEAAYNYVLQKDGWIPNDATLHFFMGTPKSLLKRDVGIDLSFNAPQRKFLIKLVHPKKKMQMEGKLEVSRNARIGHLELIVDDRDIYYIRGMTDLQTVSGDHKYAAQLEVKLTKQGSPIIFSGNITKQLGRKMALAIALNNLLKDTAFLSAHLEKKIDDKLKQYSVEGEAYLPGIFGTHTIALLQHRGSTWSNALRVKYGLLGDAKNLRHECSTVQKIKLDPHSSGFYMLDVEHELHCTQIPALSHKVQLKHAENASHLHSQLEVGYGKHWDEINNRRKVLVSQTFRNDSTATLANYMMEFILQVPEQHVNYRTQLQHSRALQGHSESNTHFKVQYNNRMPFVAGLQWKDSSKSQLSKWEGTFNMDTPWLYLYTALKGHQPQRFSYQYTGELTAGKALSIKNLVMEVFCKDKGNEKEGKLHIFTPTATYLKASTVHYLERNGFRSYSELVSLWNQPLKNEIHLENNERAKSLRFKMKTSKQEFNFTADYLNSEKPKKATVLLKALWTDHKSLPIVLLLNGEIAELKKEKMLYQKRGTLHFRHPFKLAVPQSFLLQETFTVDKMKKHYLLETLAIMNAKEESVQTLLIGYQPENPHMCASLAHPYSNRIFPKNMEICASARNHRPANCELKASVKINKRDVLGFEGSYQNKSSGRDVWHLLHVNTSHSFQLRFPHDLVLDGELFSRHIQPGEFDCGLIGSVLINRNDTSQFHLQMNGSTDIIRLFSQFSHPYQSQIPQDIQAHAVAKNYGENSVNGTMGLRVAGKDLALFEVDISNENRKNAKMLSVNALMHQSIFKEPEYAQLRLVGKAFPSRISMSSEICLNQSTFQVDFAGFREEKVGLSLSMNGQLQHNVDDLKAIPKFLSLAGSLKQKNDLNEGNISVLINEALYGLYLKNRNAFGNPNLHNITFILTQNGSQALPLMGKLEGQLEHTEAAKKGQACVQMDERSLCIDISNVVSPEQKGVTGTLTHNITSLKQAGFPTKGVVMVKYEHVSTNRTVRIGLQSGGDEVHLTVGVERPAAESPQSQISAKLQHNIDELKEHGVPFSAEGVCYCQNSSKTLVVGVKARADEEMLRGEMQRRNLGSTTEMSLSLHHDLASLMDTVPSAAQVTCSGEATSNQLSGHCSGDFSRKPFEALAPSRFSLNGSMLTKGCMANIFGHVSSDDAFAHLNLNAECGLRNRMELGFRHSFPHFQSLGIARENKVRISASKEDEYRASLNITLGKCSLKVNGEARTDNNETDAANANWMATLNNKCSTLEGLGLPQSVAAEGSLRTEACNLSLDTSLRFDGKAAALHLESSCNQKYTLQGSLNHSIPKLSKMGVLSQNGFLLSADRGSTLEGFIALQAGNCKINARVDLQPKNKTEWVLETESDCQLFKDFRVPARTQLNGSMQVEGGQAELVTALTVDGQTAYLNVSMASSPKPSLDLVFTQELPQLKEVPRQSSLSFRLGKQLKHDVGLEVKCGSCEFQVTGELQLENKLQWSLLLENKCKAMQEIGAPTKMDGSGYFLVNKVNLDAQALIIVDERTLQGLLILKATEKKQELDALFTHNIQTAMDVGVPARILLDVTSEKNRNLYKRFIQFSVDSKQITEELSFIQKADQVSLTYKLTHNLDALKALLIEDRIDVQVALDLKETKNLSVQAQYGSRLMIVGSTIQSIATRSELTWSFQHNWPWLLNSGVSASIQAGIKQKWADPNTECLVRITAGQTFLIYTINYYCSQRRKEMTIKSDHNSETLLASGYPKAINATTMLQQLENKAKATLEMQFDGKRFIADLDANTELTWNGTFELNTEVSHSVPVLSHLGIPRSIQAVLHRMVNDSDTHVSLALNCAPNTSLVMNGHTKNQLQSNELKVKMHQNVHFLLQYLPGKSELSTKVNYSKGEAEGQLRIQLEENNVQISARFAVAGPNYTKVLQLVHSFPQLNMLPRQLECMTALLKVNRTHLLRHVTSSAGKEIKLSAAYTGLLPKLSGSHEIKAELFHTFFHSFPWQSKFSVFAEHSTHSHRDEIIIGWSGKNQVFISSTLKIGKERLDCRASLTHPFNIAVNQLEVSSLSEQRGSKYSQQTQVAWDNGLPINFKVTLEDKSKNNTTAWDSCVTFLSGQLQKILHVESVLACGSIVQAANSFNGTFDLNWENKRVLQSLMYKRNGPSKPDFIQIEAVLENIFLTSCSKENLLGRMETNYLDSLEHYTSLALCDLPNQVVISGKHHLNKGDHLLQSQTRLYLSQKEKDGLSFTVALKNNGVKKAKNYTVTLELQASERVHMGVMGRYAASATRSSIMLEGNMDEKEKVKVAASKDEGCLQYFMTHTTGHSEEKGLELSACMNEEQLAALDTYLILNGRRQERLGHIYITAANQSLSLSAHGCGDSVVKFESIVGGITSQIQGSLLEKIQKFDACIWDLRKIVRPVDFLYEIASWPLKASQEAGALLQHAAKAVVQVWKQSGLRHILRHNLVLYLEKIQEVVQQVLTELQRPLETLKEAYYDVTLMPLEEVWREKTDEYMKTIKTFLPSVVKDVWLMKPVHGILTALKSALDMGSRQLLKWTDTKISRAVSTIRKPLSSLYNFSTSNCSLTLKLPVLPKSHDHVDLANISKYLIEEKLMKTMRDVYNFNPMAEYYRFKRRMIESPFESHALLIGNKHVVTFDGRVYELASKCSFLLAKDFSHDTFTVILSQENAGTRSLLVQMNQTAITIYPGLTVEENCHRIDLPFKKNGISVRKETTGIEVSNQRGVTLTCNLHQDICSLTLNGWHHGISAGLFGTNDNEAGNELLLPDHSTTESVQEFTKSWQVDSQCAYSPKRAKPCSSKAHQKTCQTFFKEVHSPLRNCFRVVDPSPFYTICFQDTCESKELKTVCNLVAAYVHLCNRNVVPIEMPSQCV
ncbi:uncharacterized protein [Ambystoma mexicanum]|uniref:uncharacterized protein isoform X2 n=1 Tax=Ambystoma mexicanum TaxID=8296 RepID=UPI0037E9A297